MKNYSVYVFEVTGYEFSNRFYEFKMVDPIWLLCCLVARVFIDKGRYPALGHPVFVEMRRKYWVGETVISVFFIFFKANLFI